MKKLLLLFSLSVALGLSATSCSTDETNTQEIVQENHSALRGNYWDGDIGVINANGEYVITADPQQLMADLEASMRMVGDTITLQTISIVKKSSTNEPGTVGYMLVASDNDNTSVGTMLTLGASGSFKLDFDESLQDPSTISCRGCATGCNLEFLNMDGGKVPYCNTNGCGDFCQTSYSSLK